MYSTYPNLCEMLLCRVGYELWLWPKMASIQRFCGTDYSATTATTRLRFGWWSTIHPSLRIISFLPSIGELQQLEHFAIGEDMQCENHRCLSRGVSIIYALMHVCLFAYTCDYILIYMYNAFSLYSGECIHFTNFDACLKRVN